MKLNLLWPTPIWEIEDDPELVKMADSLMQEYYHLKQNNLKIPFNIFCSSYPSSLKFERIIREYVTKALAEADYNWKYSEMLLGHFNMSTENEWDPPHIHLGNQLVGVFFVKAPEGSGELNVIAPSFAGGLTTHDEINVMGQKQVKRYTRTYYQIKPKVGKLVFFPHDLVHFVLPNTTKDIRVSIALNIDLKHTG